MGINEQFSSIGSLPEVRDLLNNIDSQYNLMSCCNDLSILPATTSGPLTTCRFRDQCWKEDNKLNFLFTAKQVLQVTITGC